MNQNKAHIIAEAGVNHNGKIDYAEKLISIAAKAGADSVKFQIINPYGLYLSGKYNYGHYDIKKVIENRFSTVLSDKQYRHLNGYAAENNIQFSASIFDSKGLDLLASINPPYIKIASCDLTNIRLLRNVAERGIKMILSTGMSSMQEIEFTLNELAKVNFQDIVLMHCVSIYPCPLDKSNVVIIDKYKSSFGYEIGYSDHTRTNESAIAAYCLGARWFEKHFTFDNSLEGFDHKHAQDETGFISYVNAIRAIETSLSLQKQKVSEKEAYTAERARRSLYASRDMNVGEIIKDEDVLCVRPSSEMNPNQIDLLIGSSLKKSIKKNAAFTLNHISQ